MTEINQQAAADKGGRRGPLLVLAGIVAAIILVPVLVLGWLGLVPGVSTLMGANEAKDLGVTFSPVDVQNLQSKAGIKFEKPESAPEEPAKPESAPENPAKPVKKKVFDEPKRIETRFTQEELSAAINGAALDWLPLKDIQLRLGDHTIEVSGVLSAERVPELLRRAASLGYNASDLARVAQYAEKLPGDVPVYIKAVGGVTNAQLDLDLQQVSIGRFSLPADVVGKIAPRGIHKTIKGTDQFAIDTAMPQEGSMAFSGILPTTIYLKKD